MLGTVDPQMSMLIQLHMPITVLSMTPLAQLILSHVWQTS